MVTNTADVLIVGGGIIGCALALELAQHKIKVKVFERGQLAQEASWAAAGMLSPQSEADSDSPFFQLCQQSRIQYPAYVRRLAELTGLDACYRTEGKILLAYNDHEAQSLAEDLDWQFMQGLPLVKLSRSDIHKLEPSIADNVVAGYHYPNEHQVDNRKLVSAIITGAEQLGVEFHLETHVSEITSSQGVAKGLIANGVEFIGDTVVNAAGSWATMIAMPDKISPPVIPVRGQMLALKTSANQLKHIIQHGSCYIVPRRDGRVVIGSTTEYVGYDKRVTTTGLHQLLTQAQQVIPKLAEATFVEAWAGLRPKTESGLPVLGAHPYIAKLILAYGHYRNGILLTPITAKSVTKLILGQSADILNPFNPASLIKED